MDRVTVSSRQLGAATGSGDAQVRRDLGVIGHVGQPGIGYRVDALASAIREAIGVHRRWRAVLVGAGNIGRALAAYRRFRDEGFEIVALFDDAPGVVGRRIAGVPVLPMAELGETVLRSQAEIGIIAVPPEAAQPVADALLAAGVRGILNFAPRRLRVGDSVPIVDVDFRSALERLVLEVSQRDAGPPSAGPGPRPRRGGRRGAG